MGIGPIPWTAIDRYASRAGITEPDAFDRLERLIRAMDAVYLDDAAKKAKANEPKPRKAR